MAKKKSKKTSNAMFATACVLLAIIVVIIIFLVKKDQILSNYKQTGFFDRVFGSTPEFVEKHEDKKKDTIPLKNDDVVIQIQEDTTPAKKEPEPVKVEEPVNKVEEKTEKPVEQKTEKVQEKVEEKKNEKPPVVTATTDYQLCFIKVDSDGSIIRKIVKRTGAKSDSPLTTALNYIILGPNKTLSAEKDCMSFIPKGTKLLSARVTDGVAYLNFNDAFEFNEEGGEGSRFQMMQVVYTATAFSTVNSVQILIEGKKQEYLGSEGFWIGSPLSRSSF